MNIGWGMAIAIALIVSNILAKSMLVTNSNQMEGS